MVSRCCLLLYAKRMSQDCREVKDSSTVCGLGKEAAAGLEKCHFATRCGRLPSNSRFNCNRCELEFLRASFLKPAVTRHVQLFRKHPLRRSPLYQRHRYPQRRPFPREKYVSPLFSSLPPSPSPHKTPNCLSPFRLVHLLTPGLVHLSPPTCPSPHPD